MTNENWGTIVIENSIPIAFLKSIGAAEIGHGDKTLLQHLQGVADILASWQCNESLVLAGLMHSVYGTKHFSTSIQASENRYEIKALIGDEAEEIVYLFSMLESSDFESAVQSNALEQYLQSLSDRTVGNYSLSQAISLLYLANWIEQRFKNTPRRAMKKRIFFIALKQYLNFQANAFLDSYLAAA